MSSSLPSSEDLEHEDKPSTETEDQVDELGEASSQGTEVQVDNTDEEKPNDISPAQPEANVHEGADPSSVLENESDPDLIRANSQTSKTGEVTSDVSERVESSESAHSDISADLPDSTKSELARALEAFGYGKDGKTGEQLTALKNLPQILSDFQNSRDTMYLSESALSEIEHYASMNPDAMIGDEFVMPLLVATKKSNRENNPQASTSNVKLDRCSDGSEDELVKHIPRKLSPRIRTADSPPSSDGERAAEYFGSYSPSHSPSPTSSYMIPNDRSTGPLSYAHLQNDSRTMAQEGEDSFDSINETTLHGSELREDHERSPGSEGTAFQSSNVNNSLAKGFKPVAALRRDHAKGSSSPLPNEVRRGRPIPPSRRRKGPGVDSRRTSAVFLGDMQQNQLRNPNYDDLDTTTESSLHQEIDTTSYNPQLMSPTLSASSPSPPRLNANNISNVIFQNRQKGLYNDMNENDFLDLDNDQNAARTNLMRRLRPDSRVYTRVFDSDVGLDGYPNSSAGGQDFDSMREDYPKLIRECHDLRSKVKDLEGKMSEMEKIHENELLDLINKMDEIQEDLTARKKGEKELRALESKHRFQLSAADEEVSKLVKELENNQANYHKIKQKYEDCLSELDKHRSQLRSRDEEMRYATQAIQNHESDHRKWESERKFMDEHIQKMTLERNAMQHATKILEEQKQANIELKSTIDRLKHELDEQRTINSSSSALGSRPNSIAGTVGPSFGDELKKAMESGEYDQDDGASDTTEDGRDIMKLVDGLSENGRESGDEVYEEIRIKRIKRRTLKPTDPTTTAGGHDDTLTFEEEVEVADANVDTSDLINSTSQQTQTDPIPEPPPVYRPKTEEMQIQTETNGEETSERESVDENSKEVLQKLLASTDSSVIKELLAGLEQSGHIDLSSKTTTIIHSDSSSESSETPLLPLSDSPKTGYFERFRFGSSGASFTNSIVNIITPNIPSHQVIKPEFNLMNLDFKIGSETGVGNNLWIKYNMMAGGREGWIITQANSQFGMIQRFVSFGIKTCLGQCSDF
ncbi:hypothetical protein DFH28DRAFT_1168677 [Melampsora americana]|nr:hypothetical protein DFH28DRAFT_1168677 [Melampsora americana]